MTTDAVQLETSRLLLREWALQDAPVVQTWANDEEVYRYMPWGPSTLADTEAFLRGAIRAQADEPRRVFELAIAERGSGLLVGGCGLRVQSMDDLHGDLGYTLRREAWGRGYATEAAAALLAFGFGTLGLHRIWATCHAENARSARVLEKLGMLREGKLRENTRARGVWRDSYLYARLATDPEPASRGQLLGRPRDSDPEPISSLGECGCDLRCEPGNGTARAA